MSSNAKTIIVAIISLLLLVGALGLIIHFTGGGTHDFATFYLTYGDQTIMDTTSGFVLNQFEENRFDVHYTFDESKKNAYDVEIKGNDKYSFTYTVDGEEYEFNGDTDYTGFFDVVEYENFGDAGNVGFSGGTDGIHGGLSLQRMYGCIFLLYLIFRRNSRGILFDFFGNPIDISVISVYNQYIQY